MIHIPFGKTELCCECDPSRVIRSGTAQLKSAASGAELVRQAMEHPIGTARLEQLAQGKRRATVILSDHTRPVPSRDIVPQLLSALRCGNPDIELTLLIATGLHRGTTREELVEKLGEQIVQSERIVIHDAFDDAQNVQIGILPSGAPLLINRLAVETDLLIAEGFIEPHFFAGFSGGRKSVLPGVCGKLTVLGNHCGSFIDSPYARTGILENNPIHRDMLAAAQMAKLAYIVNVVIDEQKQAVAAFAGHFEQAHAAGVSFLRGHCEAKAIPGDIVITSNGGAPLDQNIYQCVKGLTAAEASAKPGAVLILCAELADGIGGEGFYRVLKDCESAAQLYDSCTATPQDQTVPDQWQAQILARIMMKHTVIFVSGCERKQALLDMKLQYAPTLEDAVAMARQIKGIDAEITVIPDGVSVMIKEE